MEPTHQDRRVVAALQEKTAKWPKVFHLVAESGPGRAGSLGLRYRSATLLLGRGGRQEERVRLAVPNLGREGRRDYKVTIGCRQRDVPLQAGPGSGSLLREAGLGEEAARRSQHAARPHERWVA